MVNKVNIKNKNKNVINIKINTDKGKKKTTRKPKRRSPAPTINGVSSYSYGNQPPVVIQYQQPTQNNTPNPDTIRQPITNARTLHQQIHQEQEEARSQTSIPPTEDFYPFINNDVVEEENPMKTVTKRGRKVGSKNRPKPHAEQVELLDVANTEDMPIVERIKGWENKSPSKMF